jgi:hypothetical protein
MFTFAPQPKHNIMITLYDKNDIAAAYEKTTKHEGAYATCRLIDHEAQDCQEWAEHCEIDEVPAKVYYIFENDDCDVEDGSDMPWDAEHVSKIELAEKDEDGDYENI